MLRRDGHGVRTARTALALSLAAAALTLAAAVLSACATSADMRPEIGTGWCSDSEPLTLTHDGLRAEEPAEITWIASDHEGAREASAAWCSVVGPPVVIPEPHPVLAGAPTTDEFVAGAWNIWMGAADVEAFLLDRLGLRCNDGAPVIEGGFRHFALMLQEVHHQSPLVPDVERGAPVPWGIHPEEGLHEEADIVDIAQRCGLALAYVPSARNGWEGADGLGEDKGNAILSSLPLRDVTAIDLPFEGGRKVAVAASVSPPGTTGETRLDLTTVHLDVASTLVRTLMTGNQTRIRQARGMLDGLEVGGFTRHAAVVGGDFNTWVSRDASLKAVADQYPESPPVGPEATRGPFPADHIFFRSGPDGRPTVAADSYVTVDDDYGSDHKARLLVLQFSQPE
jgi:endonuclease/exonuclease/phosphatase family metal-dependent hydrolase